MNQVCTICGAIHNETEMMSYSSGRKTHWFCWACWKLGQYEVGQSEIRRATNRVKVMKTRRYEGE